MNVDQLSGTVKVAVLLKTIGRGPAESILTALGENARRILSGHMAQLGAVSPDVINNITQEFEVSLKQKKDAMALRLKNKMKKPAGSDIIPESEEMEERDPFDYLQNIESESLYELIKDEHPQTIALIVSHLEVEIGGELLSRLDEDIKVDVAIRLAGLEKVNAKMVTEVDRILGELLKGRPRKSARQTGGVDQLASILNNVDENTSELILGEIEEINPELSAQIKQRMFVFEDLILVDDRGLQKVLRKVETSNLALALKGASEEVKQKIMQNMSARASQMLQEEVDSQGAVRLVDVETAQHGITRIIQDLEIKGELIIQGRRGGALIA